jgi:predicted CopG family antitoxin
MQLTFIRVIPITDMVKTIKLSDETHEKLGKRGSFGETYEEIILKLLAKK